MGMLFMKDLIQGKVRIIPSILHEIETFVLVNKKVKGRSSTTQVRRKLVYEFPENEEDEDETYVKTAHPCRRSVGGKDCQSSSSSGK